MRKLFLCAMMWQLTACANPDSLTASDDPEIVAQNFMEKFVNNQEDMSSHVVADIAFLDYNSPNSEEGQRRIHDSLSKLQQFLQQSMAEVGMKDRKKMVFKPVKKTMQNNGQLANVTLHIFEPNDKDQLDVMELITRWRKTEDGWKLDLNPYLDKYRQIGKK